jgi:VanZ family protein
MTVWRWLRQNPWLCMWLPVGVWMALIFYLSSQPDLPHPESGWADLLFSSGAHLFMFGVLAVLWVRALGERSGGWLIALILTLLYALSDEFHQSFVPGRHADPLDVVCDALGAALGLGLWCWLRRRLVGLRQGRLID